MRHMVTIFLAALFMSSASICEALSLENFQCNKKDVQTIDMISRLYFENHSAFTRDDVSVTAQLCMEDHASAKIKLNPPSTVEAYVYLRKIHNKWQVLLLGSVFNEQALAQIPWELREVTTGSAV